MPITLDKHLGLLTTAETLSQGLSEVRKIVEREAELTAAGQQSAEQSLENIDLMTRLDFVVPQIAALRAQLYVERQFYSLSRVKAAKRQRQWRRRVSDSDGGKR